MSLTLNKKEKETIRLLLEKWGYFHKQALADIEEDVSGMKSYYFEVYPSNIGDSVYLCYNGNREFISDIDNLG